MTDTCHRSGGSAGILFKFPVELPAGPPLPALNAVTSKRDGETLQYGSRVRHHALDDFFRRPDVVDQAYPLPGEPGHLLPIAFGLGGRQNYIELAHFHGLTEEYRPPDHRKIVANQGHLGETIRPLIDHSVR